jgi:hypothetical protein
MLLGDHELATSQLLQRLAILRKGIPLIQSVLKYWSSAAGSPDIDQHVQFSIGPEDSDFLSDMLRITSCAAIRAYQTCQQFAGPLILSMC